MARRKTWARLIVGGGGRVDNPWAVGMAVAKKAARRRKTKRSRGSR